MASTVPSRGPDAAAGGSAATEVESKDAVKKADNKTGSFFINTPPMAIVQHAGPVKQPPAGRADPGWVPNRTGAIGTGTV